MQKPFYFRQEAASMVLGICSNILEEMKNFQLDRFRFVVTGFISERAEQGLSFKSYAVTDVSVDDHFTNEFKCTLRSSELDRTLAVQTLCNRGKLFPRKMFEIRIE